MSTPEKRSKADAIFSVLKNIFFVVLILQFLPSIFSNFKTAADDALSPKAHVGLLNVTGEINDPSFYIKRLEEFSKDSDIKALLLRVNSPGGFPGASQAFFSELKRFKEKKPVVVLVENLCASAAYNVAVAANTIIATPSALVGSVGVYMGLPNIKNFMESWKVYYSFVQSGAYKTVGSSVKDTSADEKKYLQQLSDDTYQQFLTDVALERKLSIKDAKVWADGKVFTGNQALKLKLIDKVGSYYDAVTEIKKLAKITQEIQFVHAKRTTGIMKFLSGDDEYGLEESSSTMVDSMADSVARFASRVYNKFLLYQVEQTAPVLK